MKAPKNFYNTVDQTKLGIDDLFRRTAENEADIVALENAVSDIEAKEELKSVKYFRVVMNRTSGDSFHVNGFRLHSSAMGEDFTFPGGSTVNASVTISNIQLLIQNETREVGVWHVDNLYPFNIDFYVPGGVDLTVYNEVQFLGGYYADTFPQSAKLLISEDGTTYKEVKSNDSITYPGADNRVDFFGFDADPVIEDIYDRIDDLETVVGDNESGLVADVNDLQTASEQYHDDIADLKTADTLINNRIDGHLLAETTTSADEGKIMAVDSTGDWALVTPAGGGSNVLIIEATLDEFNARLTFSKTLVEIESEIRTAIDAGKDVVILGRNATNTRADYFRCSGKTDISLSFMRTSRATTNTATYFIYFAIQHSGLTGSTITYSYKVINDPT